MKKRVLSLILVFCITITSFNSFAFAQQKDQHERLIITEEGVYIDNKYYTQEEFMELLENAEEAKIAPRSIAAAAGTYFIAGIGEVVITALGEVIIGGVVIGAGTWLFSQVKEWFDGRADAKYQKLVDSIPSRFRDGNVVDLEKFKTPVRHNGRKGYKEKGGWVIEEDDGSRHGGSAWKLKTKKQAESGKKNDREATLDSDGKILRK